LWNFCSRLEEVTSQLNTLQGAIKSYTSPSNSDDTAGNGPHPAVSPDSLPCRKDSAVIATSKGPSENSNPPSFFDIQGSTPYQLNDQTLGDNKVDGKAIVQLFTQ